MKVKEIPIAKCMFAKLHRPSGTGRERLQELVYTFEAVLPLPIDQCQLAFTEEGQFVIGCACLRTDLEPLRLTHEQAIPEKLPDWILADEAGTARTRLNLLNGQMQSFIQVRRKETTLKVMSAVFLVIATLVWLASQRQSNTWTQQSQSVREDIRAMYDAVLPPANGNAQPEAIRFATLLNQLSSTRTGTRDGSRHQLADELSALLSDWPESVQAQVRLMSLDQGTLRLEMSLPDNEQALFMLEFLSGRDDWEIRSRELSPAAERVDLRLTIVRQTERVNDA
jgi:hypothetical protein